MATRTKNITYILLAGLLLCGLLFVATPVMAQEKTNADVIEAINNLNQGGGFSITEILTGVIVGIIVAVIVFFATKLWIFPTFMERLNNLIKDFDEVKNDFKKHRHSTESGAMMYGDSITANSPLHLTEKGQRRFKNSGGKTYLQYNWKEWSAEFKGLDKDYTIHNKARALINEKYEQDKDEQFEDIKAYMFNEGIPQEQAILILSIGLRDMVCNEKNIKIKKAEEQIAKA